MNSRCTDQIRELRAYFYQTEIALTRLNAFGFYLSLESLSAYLMGSQGLMLAVCFDIALDVPGA